VENKNHTEQELLTALSASDRNAANLIFRKHYPIFTKWILAGGGTETDAEDIFQEAMIILFEQSQNADFRLTCTIGTYLFSVGKHLWYKRLQMLQKRPYVLQDFSAAAEGGAEDSAYEDAIGVYEERELHFRQLEAALEKLGSPCKEVLSAYYQDNKSMSELAFLFGYTNPDNAKTQKYKCLTRLKKIFFGLLAQAS
jgi:RNA polymerase sigma factor (sigma-70 family)